MRLGRHVLITALGSTPGSPEARQRGGVEADNMWSRLWGVFVKSPSQHTAGSWPTPHQVAELKAPGDGRLADDATRFAGGDLYRSPGTRG